MKTDTSVIILLVIVCVFILLGLTIITVGFFNEFAGELDYLNREIARSTGEERKYWKKRKRRLWLSMIPFVRK